MEVTLPKLNSTGITSRMEEMPSQPIRGKEKLLLSPAFMSKFLYVRPLSMANLLPVSSCTETRALVISVEDVFLRVRVRLNFVPF